jgi:hypothetical protein
MPKAGTGRLAAAGYLMLVLSSVLTWLVAGLASGPEAILLGGLYATLLLTIPVGVAGYAVLAVGGLALSGDGVLASATMALITVVVFMGAAVVNVITARGLLRWCSDRRRTRRLRHHAAATAP